MTCTEKVLEYLRSNPYATYQEMENELKIKNATLRRSVCKAKQRGELLKDKDGKYTVLVEGVIAKVEYKREIITEILETYLEDFRETQKIKERMELGKIIVKLLEKL